MVLQQNPLLEDGPAKLVVDKEGVLLSKEFPGVRVTQDLNLLFFLHVLFFLDNLGLHVAHVLMTQHCDEAGVYGIWRTQLGWVS